MTSVRGKSSATQRARAEPGVANAAIARNPGTDSGTRMSQEYRDLVQALGDGVVEYHAVRHGAEIISRVDYPLQRRVQRERQILGDGARNRR